MILGNQTQPCEIYLGRNLRTMRRSKSQDASEIPNVAKVVYSCI
uniref:Uncharacterized protein n=1 Tax=Vitis vinifera TaxID=29760 RepID=F6H8V8_VITVI